MSVLPYTVMAGAVLLSLITAIIGGGVYWIVPALIIPIIAVYFLFDRRLKAREDDEETARMHSSKGGASGAR
jgi:uncharacterized membrane protein YoaK (UPF0700 family)